MVPRYRVALPSQKQTLMSWPLALARQPASTFPMHGHFRFTTKGSAGRCVALAAQGREVSPWTNENSGRPFWGHGLEWASHRKRRPRTPRAEAFDYVLRERVIAGTDRQWSSILPCLR